MFNKKEKADKAQAQKPKVENKQPKKASGPKRDPEADYSNHPKFAKFKRGN